MTLDEAREHAAALGLEASEEFGFHVLRRAGWAMAARGDTWEECFARLGLSAQPSPALAAQSHASHEPLPSAPPGCLF